MQFDGKGTLVTEICLLSKQEKITEAESTSFTPAALLPLPKKERISVHSRCPDIDRQFYMGEKKE